MRLVRTLLGAAALLAAGLSAASAQTIKIGSKNFTEQFVVAEDVVTRGGRVQETIQIIRDHGGIVLAAGSIVDRSGGHLPDFGCPFVSLVKMNVETFAPDNLPPDLVGSTAIKPGSK
jgi:orotate phosphoribosyltransferase